MVKNQTKLKAEPGKQELFITREFEAPRELVFNAFTDPKLLEQWLGPRELKTKVEKLESKKGGSYRFINIDKDGKEFKFNGVIHDITAPERIIRTFEYEGLPEKGHVSLETVTLDALHGDRTRMKIQSVFQSASDRDFMIQSGMEKGLNDSHERLDELLEKNR